MGKLKHRAGFLESLQGGGEENPVYRDQVGFQDYVLDFWKFQKENSVYKNAISEGCSTVVL